MSRTWSNALRSMLLVLLMCGLAAPALAITSSTITLTSSTRTAAIGQGITLTATVHGASPTGTVTF